MERTGLDFVSITTYVEAGRYYICRISQALLLARTFVWLQLTRLAKYYARESLSYPTSVPGAMCAEEPLILFFEF